MPNSVPYGFIDLTELANRRVIGDVIPIVDDAVKASLEVHNREIQFLLSSWVQPTTAYQERVEQLPELTLQPLTESGNPQPVTASAHYTVAYPMRDGGHAWGDNRKTRAKLTVADVQRELAKALQADSNWLRRHMLAAVLDDSAYTFSDKTHGDLSIKPLANGDTDQYATRSGGLSTQDHYLAQANAISDTDNPFPTLYNTLKVYPANAVESAKPIVFVASTLVGDIEGLSDLIPYPDWQVNYGAGADVARQDLTRFMSFGDMVIGIINRCIVVEWASLPDDYMVAWARGAGPFIKMRQEPEAELQGFYSEIHSPDGNHREYRYLRHAGFGVYNRTAAAVMLIGSANYAVPTGYDAPLAV
jgi:hypothetical protein